MPSPDMTPAEAKAGFSAFAQEIGGEATVFVHLPTSLWGTQLALKASVYPRGMSKPSAFTLESDSFAELLEATRAKWATYSELDATRRIREMALAIIRITADLGACTDAALRQDRFSAEEVTRYGERACADANEIAGKGPFSIATLGGANQAEAA